MTRDRCRRRCASDDDRLRASSEEYRCSPAADKREIVMTQSLLHNKTKNTIHFPPHAYYTKMTARAQVNIYHVDFLNFHRRK